MKKILNRVFHRIGKWFYEFGYDWWLVVGSKLYYLDVLYDTKEWVLYEHLVDGKVRTRKDFNTMIKVGYEIGDTDETE